MPPILLAVFHCSLYREHISSWGGGGLISIPAPPRGATGEVMHNIIVFEISIHAPPRGATSHGMPCLTSKSISIHAPPRGATDSGAEFRSAHHISIHAPPRGATTHPRHDCRHVVNFNSRPSARGDGWAGACAPLPLAFQFTPLREGRPELASKLSDACKLFQFTPLREGRLPQEFSMRRAALISIHAPPRGATLRAHV